MAWEPEAPLPRVGRPRAPLRAFLSTLADLLRRRAGWFALLFAGLLLPMWGFAELADEVGEREPLAFDEPLLRAARAAATPTLDGAFLVITHAGFEAGVVPADILLVLGLALARRLRAAAYAAIALGGSALLNVGTKLLFARPRPALWESIAPEATFSFPSGHAMGSATLAWVVVLLCWRTRARWVVLAFAATFVVLVGASRVYLGVHYPSDILAGWAAASLWAVLTWLVVMRGWTPAAARRRVRVLRRWSRVRRGP